MDDPSLRTLPDAARLQAPIARLLRPLVRLLIHSGITFPALCDLLRELYVNVAEYDFALSRKEQTDSRVSLLTGIHRKEVRRLRGAGAPISAAPASVSRASRIIARWLAAPQFTDERKRPLPLPRLGEHDGDASFESLVASVTRDVRPRAVLDEWLDRKLVTIDADGRVVLAETAFVPHSGSDQQLYYLGRNLHDHAAAAIANVLGEEPRFLERAVHYEGLSEALAQRLEERSRDLALGVLQEANREAHDACETDAGGKYRWTLGVYIYREKNAKPQPESPSQEDDARGRSQ
jgi:hypothetical protein